MPRAVIGPFIISSFVGLSFLAIASARAAPSTSLSGGGSFQGAIDAAAEVDTWVVPAVAGSTLTFSLKGKGGLKPAIELLGPAGCGVIDVAAFATGVGTSKPKIVKLPLPVTGAYAVRVKSQDGSVGGYTGAATLGVSKWHKKQSHAVALAGSGTVAIPFEAVAGSKLTVSISTKKVSAKPRPDRLLSDGAALDLAPFVKVSKKSVTAKKVPISTTGSHTLVIRNEGPGDDIVVKLKLKLPKAKKKVKELPGDLPIAGLPLAGTVFPYDEISLEVDAAGLSAVRVEGLTVVHGVKNASVFLVPHVTLVAGENVLTVLATPVAGDVVKDEVVVVRSEEGSSALAVQVLPAVAHATPFSPTFVLALAGAAPSGDEIRLDADGDGLVDVTLPFTESFAHSYIVPGSFRPSVFVRTCDGLLLSAPVATVPLVQLLPPPAEVPGAGFGVAGMAGVDFDRHAGSGELFVLSAQQNAVHRFDATGTHLQSISIPGSGHEGIGVAGDGDLYLVDTANGRVVRMGRASGYVQDLGFGVNGFAGSDVPSGLSAPSDVAVGRDVSSGAPLVHVADAGHARIVVLDETGAFVTTIGGDGALVDPGSLLARPGGGAVVADRSTGLVRWLDVDGGDGGSLDLGALFAAPRLAMRDSATGRLFVSDASSERVAVVETNGTVVATVHLPGTSVVAAASVAAGGMGPWWVLGASAAQVRRFDVPDDVPAESPEAVVAKLFAATLAEDLSALEPLLADELEERLHEILADPTQKADMFAVLGALGAPQVTWKAEEACHVFAEAPPPESVVVELSLTRHATNANWVVVRW